MEPIVHHRTGDSVGAALGPARSRIPQNMPRRSDGDFVMVDHPFDQPLMLVAMLELLTSCLWDRTWLCPRSHSTWRALPHGVGPATFLILSQRMLNLIKYLLPDGSSVSTDIVVEVPEKG